MNKNGNNIEGYTRPICIYAYEDKENRTVYVGLTVDVNNRHSKHKNGELQDDGSRKYDTVASYFYSIGKELPRPIVKMSGLETNEDAQFYEGWYRDAYEKTGWRVLNVAKTGIGFSSVGGCNRKWTIEALKEEASKYTSRWDFGKNSESAYVAALDLGIIEVLFPETLIKPNGYWMVYENHLKEMEGCKTKKEYDKKNHTAYNMAVEYNFINLLFPENVRKPVTDEELEQARQYSSRAELSHNNRRLYLALYKRKLLDVYYPLNKVG